MLELPCPELAGGDEGRGRREVDRAERDSFDVFARVVVVEIRIRCSIAFVLNLPEIARHTLKRGVGSRKEDAERDRTKLENFRKLSLMSTMKLLTDYNVELHDS